MRAKFYPTTFPALRTSPYSQERLGGGEQVDVRLTFHQCHGKPCKGKGISGLGLLVPYTLRPQDFSSRLWLDPIILLSAEATREPLLPLSLQGYVREGPGIQGCGSQGAASTSFSSASSSDGDLDFRSPRSSQGQRLGKGELLVQRRL